tara:strand:+ start:18046 stop:18411 length:366 start_codon:yes stop_codon:yes gene_type:complete
VRLRNFIINTQRVQPEDIGDDTFVAASDPKDGSLDTTLTPKLLPSGQPVFQGATLEVDGGDGDHLPLFYCTSVSGSLAYENVWNGTELQMTGSCTALLGDFGGSSDVAFQIVMVAEATFTG